MTTRKTLLLTTFLSMGLVTLPLHAQNLPSGGSIPEREGGMSGQDAFNNFDDGGGGGGEGAGDLTTSDGLDGADSGVSMSNNITISVSDDVVRTFGDQDIDGSKTFLDVVNIDAAGAVALDAGFGVLTNVDYPDPTYEYDVVNVGFLEDYVSDEMDDLDIYVERAGDTMTGDLIMGDGSRIDMDNSRIVELGWPSNDRDAVSVEYLEDFVSDFNDIYVEVAGDEMEGDLSFGDTHMIIDLPLPEEDHHGVNKEYVDNLFEDIDVIDSEVLEGDGIIVVGGNLGESEDATLSVDNSVARDDWSVDAGTGLEGGGNLSPGGITLSLDETYIEDNIETGGSGDMTAGAGLELSDGSGYMGDDITVRMDPDEMRRHISESDQGVVQYTGHTREPGSFYGGSETPVSSDRLNYDGHLHATQFYSEQYFYHSDENLKSDIEGIDAASGMDLVDQIRPVSYTWDSDGRPAMGVIAQELEEVLPFLVTTSADGKKSVEYTQLIAPMVAALQDLESRNADLEERLVALEQESRNVAVAGCDIENATIDMVSLR